VGLEAVSYLAVSLRESKRIRQLFNEQVRRGIAGDGTILVTTTPHVVRWSAIDDVGWSEIAWSHLDGTNVNDVIAAQIEHFSSAGQGFVWRVYDTDLPQDLGSRLGLAGFRLTGTSELMIAQVADVPTEVDLLPGVSLVPANDSVGIDRLIEVHEKVFETDHSQLRRTLRAQMASSPWLSELVVVMAEGTPVSSARVEFLPDRDFASLWGGSTLPEWRGKGLFRAMVAYRAQKATNRGYTYLYVIASPQSRPILEHLFFECFGSVSTYGWQPEALSD
jgi:GNAT superfamily N-acetyltransferase